MIDNEVLLQSREQAWATWMRAALSGDAGAYREFLESVAPAARLLVGRASGEYGLSSNEVEERVQKILLAIHIRRGTWDRSKPIVPWINSIVQYKLSGMQRGQRIRSRFDVKLGLAAVLRK